MDELKFIHASDIHLGSVLHTGTTHKGDIGEIVKKATYKAFSRICNHAIEFEVDFVVLSGDIFDRESKSVVAMKHFIGECKRLNEKGIPVYLIAGNHDPLREQVNIMDLPPDVFIFSGDEVEKEDFISDDGRILARLIGQSYKSRALSEKIHLQYNSGEKSGVWNIGLLHTQLEPGNKNYIPCSLQELNEINNIHYWALGHIHQCKILQQGLPTIAYPGIPQGRDFGEQGPGGCLLVNLVPEKSPAVKFVPVSPVIWKRIEVKIGEGNTGKENENPRNITELQELLYKKARDLVNDIQLKPQGLDIPAVKTENVVEGLVIQWVITGRSHIHNLLQEQDDEEIEEVLIEGLKSFHESRPFLWTDSIIIRTGKPLPDMNIMKKHNPVFQEIENISFDILGKEELQKELLEELGQVWELAEDHENINETKIQLDKETMKTIIDQARHLVIEKILERGGWGED
ncbi:metallophosphoesterase family protein [Halothermothrix orenii]|nr:DNA repair exonuclease [Halothermothrix orenii]